MYLANWEETVFLFFNVVTMFFFGLNMIRRKFVINSANYFSSNSRIVGSSPITASMRPVFPFSAR